MDSNNNKITNDTNIQSNKNDPYIKFDMNEIPQSEKAELSDSDKTKKEENGKEEVAGCLCCVAFCEILIVCLSGCGGAI